MNISNDFSQSGLKGEDKTAFGLRLTGAWQKAGIIVWGVVTLLSLLSFSISIYSLNVWDRVPADQQTRYFPDLTTQEVQSHADYQNIVIQTGFSLSGYASIFTIARILGGLSLFLIGFLLIRRYNNRLMAVMMALLLSVFAAAGIWGNPLFSMAVAISPWMLIPAGLLGWALWCGLVIVYIFPDGRFTPRWTLWLAVLLVPLTFFLAFSINIFLNPDNWPDPMSLLPNVLFIGGGLVALLYRYWRTLDSDKKRRMRAYVTGLTLLMLVYFIDFFINEIYYRLAGHPLIQGYQAGMGYALIYEPVWYVLEIGFAVGLAISVFRNKILED
jgi:hypothetical protein